MAKEINKKKKKVKTKYDIAYICMLIAAGLIIIGTGTYAYYRSTMTGTTSGTIAKWSFTANNQASTFSLDLGGLYPGKTDVKYIELSAENSDLPIVYYMIFHFPNMITDWTNLTLDYDKWAEGIASWSKFYFDNAYTLGTDNGSYIGVIGLILGGEKMTLPIYYNWPYDSVPESDMEVNRVNGNTTSDKITIVARQLDLTDTESADNSVYEHILHLMDMSSCSNGEYNYANKYGYPCDTMAFNTGDVLYQGETSNLILDDGTTIEFPKYLAQLLKFEEAS